MQDALNFLASRFSMFVANNDALLHLGCKAYQAFIKGYRTYPRNLWQYFDIQKLHLGHVAGSFFLRGSPNEIAKQLGEDEAELPISRPRGDGFKTGRGFRGDRRGGDRRGGDRRGGSRRGGFGDRRGGFGDRRGGRGGFADKRGSRGGRGGFGDRRGSRGGRGGRGGSRGSGSDRSPRKFNTKE
eukprot:Blabericola_migrator_1__4737@NODE_249_length_10888_cov_100_919231_g210_i0_p5_GENE_NODE_249_length_10888_cov_100_919231_g210_i0NODE_249_length_10888_cov_100_919231_g210_i0_p5_ORF_typecomplete_len184_score23_20DUF4217/PF13959_6/7_4e12_NODE_249_length_10888_cov_100_919231_g210_i041834734